MKKFKASVWFKGQRMHTVVYADTQSQARSMVLGMFAGASDVSVEESH